MKRRLQGINDWPKRAAEASWCVTTLAKNCNVSISTLERHFHDTMGQCPRDWLQNHRQHRARELLYMNTRVKGAAVLLRYKSQHHFSLSFKRHHGYSPKLHVKRIANGALKLATGAEAREQALLIATKRIEG